MREADKGLSLSLTLPLLFQSHHDGAFSSCAILLLRYYWAASEHSRLQTYVIQSRTIIIFTHGALLFMRAMYEASREPLALRILMERNFAATLFAAAAARRAA